MDLIGLKLNNLNTRERKLTGVIWYFNCSNMLLVVIAPGDKTGNSETWNGTNWTEVKQFKSRTGIMEQVLVFTQQV